MRFRGMPLKKKPVSDAAACHWKSKCIQVSTWCSMGRLRIRLLHYPMHTLIYPSHSLIFNCKCRNSTTTRHAISKRYSVLHHNGDSSAFGITKHHCSYSIRSSTRTSSLLLILRHPRMKSFVIAWLRWALEFLVYAHLPLWRRLAMTASVTIQHRTGKCAIGKKMQGKSVYCEIGVGFALGDAA